MMENGLSDMVQIVGDRHDFSVWREGWKECLRL